MGGTGSQSQLFLQSSELLIKKDDPFKNDFQIILKYF